MATQSSDTVALTGAGGFLGWHTRAALLETSTPTATFKVGDSFDLEAAKSAIDGTQRLIHIAGINRASDDEVRDGNILFANQVAETLRTVETAPSVVVYANSTQVGNGTVYGAAKEEAAEILARASEDRGVEFLNLQLPNLFGEHGKPFYNAVTSTFCHLLANAEEPTVENDKDLTLLHAQNAADLLVGNVGLDNLYALAAQETVSGLLARLKALKAVYETGEIPDISNPFDRDLFNTYRSYLIDVKPSFMLKRQADQRGSFFEVIRSTGGESQTAFSTTVPGITRGNHFHRRKIERFCVLVGEARIEMRPLFSDKVYAFEVRGDEPTAIDMPTLWPHNITNTGSGTLYTAFWVNELYDNARPDTIPQGV